MSEKFNISKIKPKEPKSNWFGVNRLSAYCVFVTSNADPKPKASAFFIDIPFSQKISGETLYHQYLVTAQHVKPEGENYIKIHGVWMSGQGYGTSEKISSEGWISFKYSELIDEKFDIIDLACIRNKSILNHSINVGNTSVRAIDIENIANFDSSDEFNWKYLGTDVYTVGLLNTYYGKIYKEKIVEIDPTLIHGKVSTIPNHCWRSNRWGYVANEELIFVNGDASSGMSGAPVFCEGENGEPLLAGIHVGHQLTHNSQGATSNGIALVVPAAHLIKLFSKHEAQSEMLSVEDQINKVPHLIDNYEFLRSLGVKKKSASLQYDSLDNLFDSAVHSKYLLLINPLELGSPSPFILGEQPLENVEFQPFSTVKIISDKLEKYFPTIKPHKDNIKGKFMIPGADNINDSYGTNIRIFFDENEKCTAVLFEIGYSDGLHENWFDEKMNTELKDLLGCKELKFGDWSTIYYN